MALLLRKMGDGVDEKITGWLLSTEESIQDWLWVPGEVLWAVL